MIDDSIEVHRLVGARMRHEGVDFHFATGGREGVEMAMQLRPSVILLDIDMPGMDGFEVMRALKSRTETRHVPVIVVSGMCDSTEKVTAFDLGANDYVTKPFEMAELKARLRAMIRLDQLLRLLNERAEVDGLTGLSNRASFNKHIQREVAEASRHGNALTVALLDIDHFKSINDTYGHPAGDEVLMRFSRLISQSCRTSDIACRYGGEEFALIMPQTSPHDALVVCDRIRAALSQITWPKHPERSVTVSIGLVGCAPSENGLFSPEQWIEGADRALYASKHGGRNRVTTGQLPGGAKLADAA
jgi:diguanylate cyclase (GGDEF)-like protein